MYRFGLLFSWIVMALWSLPTLAQQQPPCVNRADFLKHLHANYKESPVAMGLTAGGGLLEVIVSETGSWTIIVTAPNGTSCGVATGESWESVADVLAVGPGA